MLSTPLSQVFAHFKPDNLQKHNANFLGYLQLEIWGCERLANASAVDGHSAEPGDAGIPPPGCWCYRDAWRRPTVIIIGKFKEIRAACS